MLHSNALFGINDVVSDGCDVSITQSTEHYCMYKKSVMSDKSASCAKPREVSREIKYTEEFRYHLAL